MGMTTQTLLMSNLGALSVASSQPGHLMGHGDSIAHLGQEGDGSMSDFTIEQLEALKEGTGFHMILAGPALLDQLIATEAELQQLKTRIENLADWHDTKAMKARNFPWPGEQHEARFQGKAETHETARDKLTQILEATNG